MKGPRTLVPVLIMLAIASTGTLALGGGGARAQRANATPVAVTPDPAGCTGEPRSFTEIVALFDSATPIAEVMITDTVTLPIGTSADADAVNAVTATLHSAVGCLNAGDFGRFFSLLTPNAILTQFYWVGEEIAQGNLTEDTLIPRPLPANLQQTVLAIGGVTELPDGRYAAIMVLIDPESGAASPTALHLILVRDGDRLLIDKVTEFQREEE